MRILPSMSKDWLKSLFWRMGVQYQTKQSNLKKINRSRFTPSSSLNQHTSAIPTKLYCVCSFNIKYQTPVLTEQDKKIQLSTDAGKKAAAALASVSYIPLPIYCYILYMFHSSSFKQGCGLSLTISDPEQTHTRQGNTRTDNNDSLPVPGTDTLVA